MAFFENNEYVKGFDTLKRTFMEIPQAIVDCVDSDIAGQMQKNIRKIIKIISNPFKFAIVIAENFEQNKKTIEELA